MDAAPVSILADRMARMQWQLIGEAIARCPDARVVANEVEASELEDAIARFEPEVLILGATETRERSDLLKRWLHRTAPRRRIITLFDGPGVVRLRRWRLVEERLENVSIDGLCAAIQGEA